MYSVSLLVKLVFRDQPVILYLPYAALAELDMLNGESYNNNGAVPLRFRTAHHISLPPSASTGCSVDGFEVCEQGDATRATLLSSGSVLDHYFVHGIGSFRHPVRKSHRCRS